MPVTVEVELDIFSGRPNPAWALSPAEAAAFLARLRELPPAAPRALLGQLGYRGFIVDVSDGLQASRVHVQDGIVHTTSPGAAASAHSDTGRALERWLLDAGKLHLDDQLVAIMASAFPASRR